MRARLAATILATVAFLTPCIASSKGETWSLNYLMAEMAKRQSGSIKFRERRYLKLLTDPVTIEGVLSFDGNRLEKHNLKPEEERVVIDGSRVTIFRPAQKREDSVFLSDLPALDVFVTGLRATLRGDLASLRHSFWITYGHAGADWKLTLTPLDTEALAVVREVRLAGQAIQIATVEVEEASGDRSLIELLHE